MSIRPLLMRQQRRNPLWIIRWARTVSDFRYFRARGYSIKAAWWYARNSI